MRECISHHYSCDCQEKYIAELECELRRLKQFIQDMRNETIMIKTDQGYRFVVTEQFMRERLY